MKEDALAKLQAGARGMQTRRRVQSKASADTIRVGVRVRPLGAGRGAAQGKVQVDAPRGVIAAADHGSFAFESVFENESNETLFEGVGRPLVESVLLGFNGTLFAYGQTGSGKSALPWRSRPLSPG